jgi:hypothetical protein
MIQFVSGLDWSGDPGDPRRQTGADPGFTIAIASARREDIAIIEERLNACRNGLGHGPRYVFHYKASDSRSRERFFMALKGLPVSIVVHHVDRRNWSPSYLSSTTGPERIREAISNAVVAMNTQHITHGILMVDQRRDEKNFIGHLRRGLRVTVRHMEIDGFAKIVPRPDDRDDTQLIQIADMFAGDVRRGGGDATHDVKGISITIIQT